MEENNCNSNANGCLKEEEDTISAFGLVSLSKEKLDSKSATNIEALHEKVRGIIEAKKVLGELTHQKPKSRIDNGSELLQFERRNLPQVTKLVGVIGRCSKPFDKQLTPSDVNGQQNRLLLNTGFAKSELLPLLNRNEKIEEGIQVMVYDLEGKEYEMVFTFWNSSRAYLLRGAWGTFVKEHDLKAGKNWITGWMFRHNQTQKLCFVITSRCLPLPSSSLIQKA